MLGTHLSYDKKNPVKIFDLASELRCDTFQFFTSAPQGGQKSPYTDEQVNAFTSAYMSSAYNGKLSKRNILIHAPYTINLCKYIIDEEHVNRFVNQMITASALGVSVVIHPGSICNPKNSSTEVKNNNYELGINNLCDIVTRTYNDYNITAPLLFETMSHSRTSDIVGNKIEDLKKIYDKLANNINPDLLGICIDTAHLHTSGYNILSFTKMDEFYRQFVSLFGLNKIKAFHLNDTESKMGGGKDVHKRIGHGLLSNNKNPYIRVSISDLQNSCFGYIIKNKDFINTAMITETHLVNNSEISSELDYLRACL